jgi:hypothetical protein
VADAFEELSEQPADVGIVVHHEDANARVHTLFIPSAL